MLLRIVQLLAVLLLVGAVVAFTFPGMGLWIAIALSATVVCVYQAGKRRERQAMLAWHLALATSRGRSLPRELRAFAREFPPKWKMRAYDVAADLEEGRPLSEALGTRGRLLPSWAVTSIRVGEESGRLPETLRDAAVRMTREPAFGIPGLGALAMSTVYLALVLGLIASLVTFLMIFIVPKFKRIFEGFGTDLPELTESAIGVTDFIVQYGYIAVPLLVVPFAALYLFGYGYARGWGELDLPILSGWQLRFDTPNLARNLAAAIDAALPLRAALGAIAVTHRRGHVRSRLRRVGERIDAGDETWAALARAGFLSRAEVSLLHAAARVGNLPWALRALADARERRGAYRLIAVTQFVEPAVILSLGGVVLFFCVAFFLPLVKLLNDLS